MTNVTTARLITQYVKRSVSRITEGLDKMPRSNGMSEGDFIIESRMAALKSNGRYWHGGTGEFLKGKDILALPRPRTATLPWPPTR